MGTMLTAYLFTCMTVAVVSSLVANCSTLCFQQCHGLGLESGCLGLGLSLLLKVGVLARLHYSWQHLHR